MAEQEQGNPGSATTYSSILQETDVAKSQRDARVQLLKDMATSKLNDDKGPNGVIAHISQGALSTADIPALGNVLLGIGDVVTLNLILHSPGGDGTVVEKVVSLCRAQCKRFRAIIPNDAKSAATLIALGADEIVMGPPSELGPIDAQIEVVINGVPRYLSAQSFIDARDELLDRHTKALQAKQDTSATLQMIASIDHPFTAECVRLMEFGRDVGRKLLNKHMFSHSKDKQKKANAVVDTLSSVKTFQVHGRRIDGIAARKLGLKVKMCGQNDPLWKKVWEYYTRVEIALGASNAEKLFETEHELLLAIRVMRGR